MGKLNATAHNRIRFFAGRGPFSSQALVACLDFFSQIGDISSFCSIPKGISVSNYAHKVTLSP